LQGLYYSSHHYPHGTHFSNFIGFLSSGGYSLSWLLLSTYSYTPVPYLHILTHQYSIISSYLSGRLHLYIPSRTLGSYSANLYVPRTNLCFGSRLFHIAAPAVWNSLLSTLRSSQTLNTFWKHLKTHLYQSAFNNSPYLLVQRLWFILPSDCGATSNFTTDVLLT